VSEQATRLRKWADELERGCWQQRTGGYLGDGSACALGVGLISLLGREEAEFAVRWGQVLPSHLPDAATERAIVAEVARQTANDALVGASIIDLNDNCGIDFPTFARAIRTVARRMEEQDAGAPVVTEPEAVTA
jgi:hypothetical protein